MSLNACLIKLQEFGKVRGIPWDDIVISYVIQELVHDSPYIDTKDYTPRRIIFASGSGRETAVYLKANWKKLVNHAQLLIYDCLGALQWQTYLTD